MRSSYPSPRDDRNHFDCFHKRQCPSIASLSHKGMVVLLVLTTVRVPKEPAISVPQAELSGKQQTGSSVARHRSGDLSDSEFGVITADCRGKAQQRPALITSKVGSAANRIASLVQPDPDTHVSLPVGHRRLHSFTYDGSAHRFFLRRWTGLSSKSLWDVATSRNRNLHPS